MPAGETQKQASSVGTARLVLASSSPRRRDLLTAVGIDFEVVPSGVDEESFIAGRPESLVRRLARAKAEDVSARRPDAAVLAADTIVVLRGAVLGKPRDAADARVMLARLRDHPHRVLTAVCLIPPGGRPRIELAKTWVRMRPYSEDEVEAWIATGGPLDKAGAYAIQDAQFAPVASYEGCYCNVMGLPLSTTLDLLAQNGLLASRLANMRPECAACFTES